jgi:hypothetical protein
MRTVIAINAGLRETEPIDGIPFDEVFPDDLFHVASMDAAVPDRIGVDHHDGAMLALVKASGLVCPYFVLETGFLDGVLEG